MEGWSEGLHNTIHKQKGASVWLSFSGLCFLTANLQRRIVELREKRRRLS